MKSILCGVLLVTALPAFGQEKNPVTAAMHSIEQDRSKNLVAAAEEMPADRYGYHPTPAQMTFAHLVLHTAKSNNFLCSKIGDTAVPQQPEVKDTDPKDKLVAALRASFDYCGNVLAKLNDSHLGDTLTLWGGEKASRATALIELSNDWADHYSAAAIYLRLNGLLPPTAKKK
jgi:hypothetical protein